MLALKKLYKSFNRVSCVRRILSYWRQTGTKITVINLDNILILTAGCLSFGCNSPFGSNIGWDASLWK